MSHQITDQHNSVIGGIPVEDDVVQQVIENVEDKHYDDGRPIEIMARFISHPRFLELEPQFQKEMRKQGWSASEWWQYKFRCLCLMEWGEIAATPSHAVELFMRDKLGDPEKYYNGFMTKCGDLGFSRQFPPRDLTIAFRHYVDQHQNEVLDYDVEMINDWLEELRQVSDTEWYTATKFYQMFAEWTEVSGQTAMSANRFGRIIKQEYIRNGRLVSNAGHHKRLGVEFFKYSKNGTRYRVHPDSL